MWSAWQPGWCWLQYWYDSDKLQVCVVTMLTALLLLGMRSKLDLLVTPAAAAVAACVTLSDMQAMA
jgi:hypothetical protein